MTTLIATPQSANPKALKEQWIQQLLEEVSQKSAAFDSATGEIPSTVSCDDDLDHDFDDENPVDALNGGNRHQQLMQDIQHSELIKEALRQNIDLRGYNQQVEQQLQHQEDLYLQQYTELSPQLLQLHSHIIQCDEVLASMEKTLNGFQVNLGQLSQEIQTLQDQSIDMSVRLKNRLTVRQMLGTILDGIVVTPEIIRVVCEADINDIFTHNLLELNKKMNFVKNHQGKQIKAFKDVGPEMERLRLKAAEKIRNNLLEKLKQLMSPTANIPIIQQSVLLRAKSLNHFLIQRHHESATELRLNYINIMSSFYFGKFTKYLGKLQKLQEVLADKNDLIGADDTAKKGLFGTGRLTLKDKTNVFTLGDRIQVLQNIDGSVILTHVAETQQQKFPLEAIFRSLARVLMDNASSEYSFITDFFVSPRIKKTDPSGASVAGEVFSEIFGKTLRSYQEAIKNYIDNSFDAVGMLLCIRVNTQHQLIMQKRRIPCLDQFLNALTLLFWPRFQMIVDLHVQSIKKAAQSAGGLFSGSIDIHPHYITRRYAEFSASILALNEGYNDHLLDTSLSRLKLSVEEFIARLAGELNDRKRRLILLINNFDLIVGIFDKYQYTTVQKEKDYFSTILDENILAFVNEESKPVFGDLITFVKSSDSKDPASLDAQQMEKIARDFANNWRNGLNDINTSAMQSFSNFKNGTTVVHAALKELVFYYQNFLTLWEKRFPPGSRVNFQPIMMHQLLVEIKSKYKSSF